MMKNKIMIIPLAIMFAGTPVYAEVNSLSNEKEIVDRDGTTARVISVNGNGRSGKRVIRNKLDQRIWCDAKVNSLCDSNKMKPAKRVCAKAYSNTSVNRSTDLTVK